MSEESFPVGDEPEYITQLKEGREVIQVPTEVMDELQAAGSGHTIDELRDRLDRYFHPTTE